MRAVGGVTLHHGNYIRPGPRSRRNCGPIVLTDTAAVSYYLRGNVVDGRDDLTADNGKLFDRTTFNGRALFTLVDMPFAAPAVRTTSAQQALQDVLAGPAATRWTRGACATSSSAPAS